MYKTGREDDHERYKELCALAQTGLLSPSEQLELESHLQICECCRMIYEEYSLISKEGMAVLAAVEIPEQSSERWDDQKAKQKLFAAIHDGRSQRIVPFKHEQQVQRQSFFPQLLSNRWTRAAMAACLLMAAVAGSYYQGEHSAWKRDSVPRQTAIASIPVPQAAASTTTELSSALAAQRAEIVDLEERISAGQEELSHIRAASNSAEKRANDLGSVYAQKEAEVQQLIQERDGLAAQLHDSQTAYQNLQAQFIRLRSDHDQTLLHTAALESRVEELVSTTHDQERKLKDDAQYLTSDRDIRELMGARKLYIADVFDVDSGSRPRKPFGRVFYTQNKSLVFYAFDLDRQPGVKTASAFQVWGQRDSESKAEAHPMNLGILYMDSETNRRWVLRYDDPKQLAEIDAVFVTVEPRGGSQKPTGKPFLYALLRKEVNHP